MFNTAIKPPLILKIACWYLFSISHILVSTVIVAATVEDKKAPEDWYQIEFVLFEHLKSDRDILRYEDLKYVLPIRDQYQFLVKQGSAISPSQFEQVGKEEATLSKAISRLKASPEIKIYSSGGWKQAISRDQVLPPVKIAVGVQYGDKYQLEGELTIRRGRYMHVEINVFLADFKALPYEDLKKWLFQNEADRWPFDWLLYPLAYQHPLLLNVGESYISENSIHLKQSRRVKVGEVHYIDHPALGLITTIKKIEAPFEYGETDRPTR